MSQAENDVLTHYLFEYGEPLILNWEQPKFLRLQAFLEEVWVNRSQSGIMAEWYKAVDEQVSQPILQCIHKRKGKEEFEFSVRASNYAGIIRFEDTEFHLMPKLFKDEKDEEALKKSNAHLLWWLSYNKWLSLPKRLTSLSHQRCDFLEILIYLFATYTLEQLNLGPYKSYQEMEAETTFLKGQLIFSEYVSNYLGRANYQKMYCRYDSFEIDNTFNRIIKHVCKQLIHQTTLKQSHNTLSDILRILDEVSDIYATIDTCDEVVLNRMFGDYQMVLDYCRMFLANSQSTSNNHQSDAFAFLVPMEKVFEEFVLGFIQKELRDTIKVTGQVRGVNLTKNHGFALRPDLKMKHGSNEFIADTKYKLIYEYGAGVSQSDLYQMVAYAIRFKVDRIFLFYPMWKSEVENNIPKFEIVDELADGRKITIEIHSLDVIVDFSGVRERDSIQNVFSQKRKSLKEQLERIVC